MYLKLAIIRCYVAGNNFQRKAGDASLLALETKLFRFGQTLKDEEKLCYDSQGRIHTTHLSIFNSDALIKWPL